jgi:hypothetical protein
MEIVMSKKPVLAMTGACAASVVLAALLLAAGDASAQASGKLKTRPSISCAFGNVVGGRCICPPGWRRVHAGLNAWRCLRPDPWIGSKATEHGLPLRVPSPKPQPNYGLRRR